MRRFRQQILGAFLLFIPGVAFAYIGPGAGLTAIGAAIAFVGAIVLVILGFIWYPIKRLMARFRRKADRTDEGNEVIPPQ